MPHNGSRKRQVLWLTTRALVFLSFHYCLSLPYVATLVLRTQSYQGLNGLWIHHEDNPPCSRKPIVGQFGTLPSTKRHPHNNQETLNHPWARRTNVLSSLLQFIYTSHCSLGLHLQANCKGSIMWRKYIYPQNIILCNQGQRTRSTYSEPTSQSSPYRDRHSA